MADTPEMGRTPSTDELVPELTFDEIDRAFDNNEFCFYLQPKCNAATGAIVGAEALVRWNHPKYGVVSPGRFVPMLEQAGQISRLDVFVWRSVVRMLARWEREGRNLVPISVNVSMVDIDQMDVADTLTGLLNEYDVDARLLQAEITESAVARNLSKVESTIRKLHADNIAVLMDDFGSAYSSLNMLKDINVEVIKLDMKFIDLDEDNASKGLKIGGQHGQKAATAGHRRRRTDQTAGRPAAVRGMPVHPRVLLPRTASGGTDGEAVGRTSRRPAFLGYVKRFHAWQLCACQRPYHA